MTGLLSQSRKHLADIGLRRHDPWGDVWRVRIQRFVDMGRQERRTRRARFTTPDRRLDKVPGAFNFLNGPDYLGHESWIRLSPLDCWHPLIMLQKPLKYDAQTLSQRLPSTNTHRFNSYLLRCNQCNDMRPIRAMSQSVIRLIFRICWCACIYNF
jgi:hypothetical protein